MQSVIAWLTKYWPFIVAIVPSLLVAFTKAPTDGKVGDWIKWGLQLFSILTHKDEPGTLKLPLMTSRMHRKLMGPTTPPIIVGLIVLLLTTQTSCSWLQTKGKEIGKDVVDCAVEAARGQSLQLIKTVYDLLEGDKSGWGTALAALEAAGMDALPCAIMAVIGDLLKPSAPGVAPQVANARVEKAQFLLSWLKARQTKKVYTFGGKGVSK